MKKRFRLTDEHLRRIRDCVRPELNPRQNQRRVDDVWRQIGIELGFRGLTARPVRGNPNWVEAETWQA